MEWWHSNQKNIAVKRRSVYKLLHTHSVQNINKILMQHLLYVVEPLKNTLKCFHLRSLSWYIYQILDYPIDKLCIPTFLFLNWLTVNSPRKTIILKINPNINNKNRKPKWFNPNTIKSLLSQMTSVFKDMLSITFDQYVSRRPPSILRERW